MLRCIVPFDESVSVGDLFGPEHGLVMPGGYEKKGLFRITDGRRYEVYQSMLDTYFEVVPEDEVAAAVAESAKRAWRVVR